MKTTKFRLNRPLLAIGLAVSMGTAQAVPVLLDFGTSWPMLGDSQYSDPLSPYSRVVTYEAGLHSNEYCIAEFLNRGLDCSTFSSTDVFKDDNPVELDAPDGYFAVPEGWDYLVVQYDGPNGGSVLLHLEGNAAKVPFDSSMMWGTGDKYAVTHFSVAGPTDVPDGGATLSMIGIALGSLAAWGRFTKK